MLSSGVQQYCGTSFANVNSIVQPCCPALFAPRACSVNNEFKSCGYNNNEEEAKAPVSLPRHPCEGGAGRGSDSDRGVEGRRRVRMMTEGAWRPRGALARALMDRMKNDQYLDSTDQTQWYQVNLDAMGAQARSLWHPFTLDGATRRWLSGARTTAANLPLQIYHSVARLLLGMFMTQTDVNGWLHRGSMFIFSTNQLSSLLNASGFYPNLSNKTENRANNTYDGQQQQDASQTSIGSKLYLHHSSGGGTEADDDRQFDRYENFAPSSAARSKQDLGTFSNSVFPIKGRMLDLGAGDGDITARMEALFEEIAVTEVSGTMRNRLSQRGYNVLDVETWMSDGPYDLISCLNLLDRCTNPKTLLRDIRSSLAPDGVVLIALVLPFKPYVERGTKDNRPLEFLDIGGSSFEAQAESFFQVLRGLGFRVRGWSRAPYLCNGDLNQSYYYLDDLLVVANKSDDHHDS